jgi:hypothetical protein
MFSMGRWPAPRASAKKLFGIMLDPLDRMILSEKSATFGIMLPVAAVAPDQPRASGTLRHFSFQFRQADDATSERSRPVALSPIAASW